MTFLVIGNCQATSLQLLLEHTAIGRKYDLATCTAVNNVKDPKDIMSIISEASIVIHQPLSNGYMNGELTTKKILQQIKGKSVIIPNCYFQAFYPSLEYFKNSFGADIDTYNVPYHDVNIFKSLYDESSSWEDMFNDEELWTYEHIHNMFDVSMKKLKAREENVMGLGIEMNVHITDYIQNNYKKERLFNTFNHPSDRLIREVSDRIVEHIMQGEDVEDKVSNYIPELFSEQVYPIYPSVKKHLGLQFADIDYFTLNTKKKSISGAVRSYEHIYSRLSNETINLLKSRYIN